MQQSDIHALDFDGVICDSAVETGIAGWKAGSRIWSDQPSPLPPEELIEGFRLARPIIETGYESILAMRLLFLGVAIEGIINDFEREKHELMARHDLSTDMLKRLFGSVRDEWIASSPEEWRQMNPLFPGVAEKLRSLNACGPWYIVTTKQERFVREILGANHIPLDPERIYGLDRNMGKEKVLLELQERHRDRRIHFVEDRLPTLINVMNNKDLQNLRLSFADWGYNTSRDKDEAARHARIEIISLEDFML